MSRLLRRATLRRITILLAAVIVALAAAACGQQKIHFSQSSDVSSSADTAMANLFHQRCAGCHTLSYAAADGSGNNPRTYLAISGPNFNVRCERPEARVLYAIENGGFSGAYMPANILVGQQAREMAQFVAKFSGRQAPVEPDNTPCEQQPIGSLPDSATGGVTIPKVTTTTSNTAPPSSSNQIASEANPSPNGN